MTYHQPPHAAAWSYFMLKGYCHAGFDIRRCTPITSSLWLSAKCSISCYVLKGCWGCSCAFGISLVQFLLKREPTGLKLNHPDVAWLHFDVAVRKDPWGHLKPHQMLFLLSLIPVLRVCLLPTTHIAQLSGCWAYTSGRTSLPPYVLLFWKIRDCHRLFPGWLHKRRELKISWDSESWQG